MSIHLESVPFSQWELMLATESNQEYFDRFIKGASTILKSDSLFVESGSFTARHTVGDTDVFRTIICINVVTIADYIKRGDIVPVYESFFRSAIVSIQRVLCAFGLYTLNSELRANLLGFIIRKMFEILWTHEDCRHTLAFDKCFREVTTLFHWKRAFIALGSKGVTFFAANHAHTPEELDQLSSIAKDYEKETPDAFGSILTNDSTTCVAFSDAVLNRISKVDSMPLGVSTIFHEVCHYSDQMLECLSETATGNAETQIGIASHLFKELNSVLTVTAMQDDI